MYSEMAMVKETLKSNCDELRLSITTNNDHMLKLNATQHSRMKSLSDTLYGKCKDLKLDIGVVEKTQIEFVRRTKKSLA